MFEADRCGQSGKRADIAAATDPLERPASALTGSPLRKLSCRAGSSRAHQRPRQARFAVSSIRSGLFAALDAARRAGGHSRLCPHTRSPVPRSISPPPRRKYARRTKPRASSAPHPPRCSTSGSPTRSWPAKACPSTCRSPCCGGPRRCSCCWSIAPDGSIAMRRRRMRPVAPVRRMHDDLPMCRRVNPTPVRMAAAREHKNVLALFVDDSQFEVPVKRRGFDLLPHDGKAATR